MIFILGKHKNCCRSHTDMGTMKKQTHDKPAIHPDDLETMAEHTLLEDSLNIIKRSIGLAESIALLPYNISIEGIGEEYFLALNSWEMKGRETRDKRHPLKAYSAAGAGLVIPEEHPGRVYGNLIGKKAYTESLQANRIVEVPVTLYGNYSRLLILQLKPPNRYPVPDSMAHAVRKGASVNLRTFTPEEITVMAASYNK
jgi:hypothetical protein